MNRRRNAQDVSLESLLLMIAYAKEEARRLGLGDVAQMLELPELSVMQTMTGFEKDDETILTTMVDALSGTLEKTN